MTLIPKERLRTGAAAPFWTQCQRFPPILVRLLATKRNGWSALTDLEISERSGLSVLKVALISECLNWDDIEVGDFRAFIRACGVDFSDRVQIRKCYHYLRRPAWKHLRTSEAWPRFQALLIRWQRSVRS